jgi:hypothetical protein
MNDSFYVTISVLKDDLTLRAMIQGVNAARRYLIKNIQARSEAVSFGTDFDASTSREFLSYLEAHRVQLDALQRGLEEMQEKLTELNTLAREDDPARVEPREVIARIRELHEARAERGLVND